MDKTKWEIVADLKAKEIQIEAIKRDQTLTQYWLKQAKEAINEYMANPILHPTTKTGKYVQIQKLIKEVEELKDVNIDLSEGYRSRLKHKDDKVNNLQKQIANL